MGDVVGDAGEGPGVGWPLAVEAAENVDLDRAVLEACRDDQECWHVDVIDAGHSLQRDRIGQLDPQRPAA
jgi:hypothetical protein